MILSSEHNYINPPSTLLSSPICLISQRKQPGAVPCPSAGAEGSGSRISLSFTETVLWEWQYKVLRIAYFTSSIFNCRKVICLTICSRILSGINLDFHFSNCLSYVQKKWRYSYVFWNVFHSPLELQMYAFIYLFVCLVFSWQYFDLENDLLKWVRYYFAISLSILNFLSNMIVWLFFKVWK